jgi:hypothetical protein
MHNGSTIVSFRPRVPEHVIIPWADGELIDGASEAIDAYPGLAEWWRRAERLWIANRAASSKMNLNDRLNFQRLLQQQFPIAEHRVVYSASGQHLAACRLEDADSVIEHALYWAPVASRAEARYVTAVLNSQTLAHAVVPLQSRGQHNPRHFDTHIFGVPFPVYDQHNEIHNTIVDLGAQAEAVGNAVKIDESHQFQRVRRAIREALSETGIQAQLDIAVAQSLIAAGVTSVLV